MTTHAPLEQRFLDHVMQGPEAVTIFLLNGVKLQGHIIDSDDRTILLKRENMTQLVYKHAISTLMPLNSLRDL